MCNMLILLLACRWLLCLALACRWLRWLVVGCFDKHYFNILRLLLACRWLLRLALACYASLFYVAVVLLVLLSNFVWLFCVDFRFSQNALTSYKNI